MMYRKRDIQTKRIPGLVLALVMGVPQGAASSYLNHGGKRLPLLQACTEEQRARGLMFVDDLQGYVGMVFHFDPPQRPVFWMKNTPLALDLIYLDETQTITAIHHHAKPHDLERIQPPKEPTSHVLELRAGLAKTLGLKKGDSLNVHINCPS